LIKGADNFFNISAQPLEKRLRPYNHTIGAKHVHTDLIEVVLELLLEFVEAMALVFLGSEGRLDALDRFVHRLLVLAQPRDTFILPCHLLVQRTYLIVLRLLILLRFLESQLNVLHVYLQA